MATGGGGSFTPPPPTLSPSSTITATKAAGNPTFNFESLPESIVKVGSTYYCVYMDAGQDDLKLATATDRDGPWTASSTIYTFADVSWAPAGATQIYAPFLMQDAGTFYLYYSIYDGSDGSDGHIGLATAGTVTGPYTDHGSAVLSPGSAGTWDSRRVGEPGVMNDGGTWLMAYMGETTTGAFGASEKLGFASASAPEGPWTKAGINPLAWGSGGSFDDALMADPDIFLANGYYWVWYVGAGTTGPPVPANEGFLYATDPIAGPWTRHASNPILSVGAGGQFDDERVFRGCIWVEGGTYSGVYTGMGDNTLANAKGGNFTLSFS